MNVALKNRIIGEDGIVDTTMIADNYDNYLDDSKGYRYIGKIKECGNNGVLEGYRVLW
ncbi:hypothetical protein ACFPA1_22435 [Neobacillus sp. GCM10023253]|uniref:hypothetical protein n=1 Tax=Neobacillus sp. GCM10023253 TaxID=3252644 RepID=UPI00361910B4